MSREETYKAGGVHCRKLRLKGHREVLKDFMQVNSKIKFVD